MHRRRILIAPDKFKGSLTAMQICEAVAAGIKKVEPEVDFDFVPMADGGDGSLLVLAEHLKLQEVETSVENPLGHLVNCSYYRSEEAAYIEMAEASGLVCLNEKERNPLRTSTFGAGQLILHALDAGLRKVFLFLGGSATNDGAMGLAQALGFQFLGPNGEPLRGAGENLAKVAHIMPPTDDRLNGIEIICLCDVQNPLLGENGATAVYGPQKGATPDMILQLEDGMEHFAKQLERFSGQSIAQLPGGGAAGGLAAGLVALCNAKIKSGIETIQDWVQLESRVQTADLIISGEGKLDQQTLEGKVIAGVMTLVRKYKKDALLVVGKNELTQNDASVVGQVDVISIMDVAPDITSAMTKSRKYLRQIVEAYFANKKASPEF